MAERQRRTSRTRPFRGAGRASQSQTQRQELARWSTRIAYARTLRQEWADKYQVDRLAHTFNGDAEQAIGLFGESQSLLINRYFPTIKAQIPGLLHQQPKFFVRAKGHAANDVSLTRVAQTEAVLTQIAQQDDHLALEAKLALQQAFWAIGVLKCVYDPQLERNPQAGQPLWVRGDDGEPMYGPDGQLQPLIDDESGEQMKEAARIMHDEIYRWQWVHWGNMLLPDAGPAYLRWPWIAEEIEVSLEEAQDDTRFPSALREQLVPTRKPRGEAAELLSDRPMEPHELDQTFWYVECWDLRHKRHLIVAEGQPFSGTRFLLEEDTPPGVEDHPYALLLGFTQQTDPHPSPWPIPHCWNWLALQHEYNDRRTQMMNAARRSARKILFDAHTFPNLDEATAALDSPRDMEAVQVTDLTRLPIVLADPGSPPDIARDIGFLENDWLHVTGTPGERLGTPDSETATQAVIADRSATLRESEMKYAVTLWLSSAGRKMTQLLKDTMTLETWVKIRDWSEAEVQEFLKQRFGPMAAMLSAQSPSMKALIIERYGKEKWLPTTREDLQFEADVGVVPGSMRPRTPEADRQQALLFMKTVAEVGAVMPQLLTSKRFVTHVADLFELGDELLVDELIGSVQKGLESGALGAPGGRQRPGANGTPTPAQMQNQSPLVSRMQNQLVNAGL